MLRITYTKRAMTKCYRTWEKRGNSNLIKKETIEVFKAIEQLTVIDK